MYTVDFVGEGRLTTIILTISISVIRVLEK